MDPRALYGRTSEPLNAYDCWLASAWTPELSYVDTSTATPTKESTASMGASTAEYTPPRHAPLMRTPTLVFCSFAPTETAAFKFALVETVVVPKPSSKCTWVFTPQATNAFVSSYTGTEATSVPPTAQLTVSSCVTSGTLRKRYFLATAYSKYCASALVAHGGPYARPPAHVDRSKLESR